MDGYLETIVRFEHKRETVAASALFGAERLLLSLQLHLQLHHVAASALAGAATGT